MTPLMWNKLNLLLTVWTVTGVLIGLYVAVLLVKVVRRED